MQSSARLGLRWFSAVPVSSAEFSNAMAQYKIGLGNRIGLAVSGGVDSMALLRLAAEWHQNRHSMPLYVLSVNHNLRPEAAAEVSWVTRQCSLIGESSSIPIVHIPLEIDWASSDSLPYSKLQLEARHARYKILADACGNHNISHLLVAHHLNDQAETFLLRLARASGIEGLICMQPQSVSMFGTSILRPLLSFSKERLIASCEKRFNQNWREDPSNQNNVFDRVRVRSVVSRLPPSALNQINATAHHMLQLHLNAQVFYREIMNEACTWTYPLASCWVNINRLRKEHPTISRSVLTKIFQTVSCENRLNLKALNDFIQYIYEDTEIVFGFRNMFGCRIRRYPESIIIMPDYSRLHHQQALSRQCADNMIWGGVAYTMISPEPSSILSSSWQPLSRVWKQLRQQLKNCRDSDRLPNTVPASIKEAETVALVSSSNRVIAVPALPAISTDLYFSSKSTYFD